MTDLERITREVERDLQRWCDDPVAPIGTGDGPVMVDTDLEPTQVHRSYDASDAAESGIRYQKCGGGRRVIKKQSGS